jgi:hypothetical protein
VTTVSWDASELNKLAADLGRVGPRSGAAAYVAVKASAAHVKDDAAAIARGIGPHVRQYPASIGFDVHGTPGDVLRTGVIEAEIGPDKDKPQGALGNILEYGTSNNAPDAHLGPSLDREGPEFERATADAVGRWW